MAHTGPVQLWKTYVPIFTIIWYLPAARGATVQWTFTSDSLTSGDESLLTLGTTWSGNGVSPWALIDHATGTGALGSSNLGTNNRRYDASLDAVFFSAKRESDAQTPIVAGGNSQTTWMTFSVCPNSGVDYLDYSSATLSIETHAKSTLGGTTGGKWTLYRSSAASSDSAPYFSTSGSTVAVGVGTQMGAQQSGAGAPAMSD